ncbi:MAG: hypothetical protein J6A99_02880 [Clostridia bacterium]|nr:hypothetical protein [Clostridia bacterium]
MSRKKKKMLEEQRRMEELNQQQGQAYGNWGANPFGQVDIQKLPYYNGNFRAIQLPPIIQPVAIIPTIDQIRESVAPTPEKEEPAFVESEFDDFEDWCD